MFCHAKTWQVYKVTKKKSDMFLAKYLKEEEEAIAFQQVVAALHP